MASNFSFETYSRTLRNRTDALRKAYEDFIKRMVACGTYQKKLDAASEVLKAINDISDILDPQDRPQWLSEIRPPFETIVANPGSEGVLIDSAHAITSLFRPVIDHRWNFDSPVENVIDFDEIYRRHLTDSKIPDLFERIATILEKIVQSEDVDRLKVIKLIEKLTQLLRNNAKGSLIAIVKTQGFVSCFAKHAAWEYVKTVPGVEPLVKAFEQARAELEPEVVRFRAELDEAIEGSIKSEMPQLEYSAPLSLTDQSTHS